MGLPLSTECPLFLGQLDVLNEESRLVLSDINGILIVVFFTKFIKFICLFV